MFASVMCFPRVPRHFANITQFGVLNRIALVHKQIQIIINCVPSSPHSVDSTMPSSPYVPLLKTPSQRFNQLKEVFYQENFGEYNSKNPDQIVPSVVQMSDFIIDFSRKLSLDIANKIKTKNNKAIEPNISHFWFDVASFNAQDEVFGNYKIDKLLTVEEKKAGINGKILKNNFSIQLKNCSFNHYCRSNSKEE